MIIHTPGLQLFKLEMDYKDGDIDLPLMTIDLGDCAHFETEPIATKLPLPPIVIEYGIGI
jgi:hypothetical protein